MVLGAEPFVWTATPELGPCQARTPLSTYLRNGTLGCLHAPSPRLRQLLLRRFDPGGRGLLSLPLLGACPERRRRTWPERSRRPHVAAALQRRRRHDPVGHPERSPARADDAHHRHARRPGRPQYRP